MQKYTFSTSTLISFILKIAFQFCLINLDYYPWKLAPPLLSYMTLRSVN